MPKTIPPLIPGDGDEAAARNGPRWLALLNRAADLVLQVQEEIDGFNPEAFGWENGPGGLYDRTGWPLFAGLSQDLDRVASSSGEAGGDSLDERIRDLCRLTGLDPFGTFEAPRETEDQRGTEPADEDAGD